MTDNPIYDRALADQVSLDELIADIWQRLDAAPAEAESSLLLPVLATADADGNPQARSMVLRGVGVPQRQLLLFSDFRGEKVTDLNANAAVSLIFYDPELRYQLRVTGQAEVAAGEDVRGIWDTLPPAARILYSAVPAPGTEIANPDSGLPRSLIEARDDEVLRDQTEGGFKNFAVLAVSVHQIDWLLLTNDGNRAARFAWNADGNFSASWRIP